MLLVHFSVDITSCALLPGHIIVSLLHGVPIHFSIGVGSLNLHISQKQSFPSPRVSIQSGEYNIRLYLFCNSSIWSDWTFFWILSIDASTKPSESLHSLLSNSFTCNLSICSSSLAKENSHVEYIVQYLSLKNSHTHNLDHSILCIATLIDFKLNDALGLLASISQKLSHSSNEKRWRSKSSLTFFVVFSQREVAKSCISIVWIVSVNTIQYYTKIVTK